MLKTISILVDNEAGVLARVTNLFSRRGYNIDSLAVGTPDVPDRSRITVIVDCDSRILDQIIHQVGKLVCVHKVEVLDDRKKVSRELVLIKVRASKETLPDIRNIVEIFRGKIVDVSPENVVIELTGSQSKIDAICDMLAQFEIIELARTGTLAMSRGPVPVKEME